MKFTKKDKRTKLEKEIDRQIDNMSDIDDPDKLKAACENVETLSKAKSYEKPKEKLNPNTIVSVAGSLLGIGLILGFEKANVITSKALGFVLKGRV